MARKPASDAARARFAQQLEAHVRAGTRPSTVAGEPWTYASLAREVQSSRETGDFASPRSVSNWCKGKALPAAIDPILRALFGPPSNDRHAEAREQLRAAFIEAQREGAAAMVAGVRPGSAGGSWHVQDEQFVLDRAVQSTDRAAAANPQQGQLQTAIRRFAGQLADAAQRLANSQTWGGLRPAAAQLQALVSCDQEALLDHLGDLYALMLQLGQFLDTDVRVQRDPSNADGPLDPAIHASLSTLVRLAAPWLRSFPTVAGWDEAAGRVLVREDLFQPAREFTRIAREQQAIPARDAEEITLLAEIATGTGYQGQKAGARAVGDVQNLIFANAEAIAYAGMDPSQRPLHVSRAIATLEAGRSEVMQVAEALPPDLRHALLMVIQPDYKNILKRDHKNDLMKYYIPIITKTIGSVLSQFTIATQDSNLPGEIIRYLSMLPRSLDNSQVIKFELISEQERARGPTQDELDRFNNRFKQMSASCLPANSWEH
ncbi:hypothetical protein LRS73_35560 (plasmid) [Methylobacterium currus]|uniref:hypothetical protein n=1 Tax=Methylobacterium currus TaxID=2051553 RepID=UPI001E4B43A6|nr:hypothetical protein [Methylobacterium currus]UHC20451.1 hypothetical protein LRS73_35560 [Methylobacterium currus]